MESKIDKETNDLLNNYLERILELNKLINLTRITDIEQAEILHLEDSLSALEEINEAPEGLYGDLGSGGGFPGVPLGIVTNRKTIIIDSVKKKMIGVQNIIDNLGIENISTYAGRIEELAIECPEEFSVLTARALSQLPSLLELGSPLLELHGCLICLKSHIEDQELDHAIKLEDKVGMKLIKDRDFYLSDSETYRRILMFEKIKQPTIKLPRRIGMAQKKPL